MATGNDKSMDYKNTDIIFCGNPGVGKSTLLSSISKVSFKSGISAATGMTKDLEYKESPHFQDVRFADTPGLADVKQAERAAAAITKALQDGVKNKRNAKIFFIVLTQAARIIEQDLFTIKQVTQSIKLPGGQPLGQNNYGVIINKCEFMEHRRYDEWKEQIEAVFYTKSRSVPCATSYIAFLPRIEKLANEDDGRVQLESHFIEWIFDFPGIEAESVKAIDVSSIEAKLMMAKEQYLMDLDRVTQRLKNERDIMMKEKADMVRDMTLKIEEANRRAIDVEKAYEGARNALQRNRYSMSQERQGREDAERELEEMRKRMEDLELQKNSEKKSSFFKKFSAILPVGKVIITGVVKAFTEHVING